MFSTKKRVLNFDNWVAVAVAADTSVSVISGQDNIGAASPRFKERPQVGEGGVVWVSSLLPSLELEFLDVSEDMSREYEELKLLIIEHSQLYPEGREIARVLKYSGNPKDKFGIRVIKDDKVVFETK